MPNRAPVELDSRLRWLVAPLTARQILGVSAGLVVLAAGYCLLHEAVRDQGIDLRIAGAWALASVVPFFCAFELLKRRAGQTGMLLHVLMGLAAANGLSVLGEAVLLGSVATLPAELFSRVPINALLAGLIGLGAVLRRPASQIERAATDGSPELPVRPSEVQYVRSAGNYIELHCGRDTHLVRVTMGTIERQWSSYGFIRIHRSTLVSRAYVAGLESERGVGWVRLTTGERLRVSRAFRHRLEG